MVILLGHHIFLIATNQTTNEYLKKYKKNHPTNPFHSSLFKNFKKFCTSRKKKGHLNFSVYTEKPSMRNGIRLNGETEMISGKKESEDAETDLGKN